MKILLLFSVVFLLSNAAHSQKNSGDVIKAGDFNSSSFHIGSVQQSILPEISFIALAGDCWVQLKGQSIVGSDLAALGVATLPDARGTFIKIAGINEIQKKSNGAPYSGVLGVMENDSFQGHWHDFYVGSTTASFQHLNTHNQLATADNAGSRSLQSAVSVASKDIINSPKSDTLNGTPRTGSETKPANISLNTFIKINKSCN